MDSIYSTDRKFNRMFANILTIFVILALAFPVTGRVAAQGEPNPWLIAFPENDAVEGWEWPEGVTVYLTVDNAPQGFVKEGIAQVTWWGDPRTYVRFEFSDEYDLQVGDQVMLTDEFGTTVTHTVQNLSVTHVDPVSNVVGGTADAGAMIQVWPHETGELLEDLADDGTWQVDYTGVADLVPGTCGRSQILVEANATAVDWCAPKPSLVAFPENDAVDGWEWPAGKTVTLTIDNAPEGFYQEATAEVTPWGDPRTYVRFEFSDEYDLQVGDQVTLTGEDGTTRMHTVQNLAVTRVNAEDNLIKGTADAGAEVHVWPHATGQELVVDANPIGKWNVDFSGIYDLAPGDGGRSEVRDEAGNATAVDWYIPNPHFGVRANIDQVESWEWAEGERVTLKIDDPDTGGGIDYTATQSVGLAPWDPSQTYVFFNLWNVYNIQPGDLVSLSNGPVTKTTTVTNLAFTDIDLDLDVVTGVAAPNSHVDIWACDNVTCINRHVDADSGGVWTADFGNPGHESDEQESFDIVLGTWVDSSQGDEDGDQTYWGQRVPNPYIEAAPYSDWIHAREWPLGTLMTLEIDDPSDGLGDVDYSDTATMQQAPWNPGDPNDIVADFRWPDQFVPGPGYVLTMRGNGQSKTLTISQLNMTGFDLQADTISGTGTPNAQIQVCANVPNRCITRWVTAAEGSGNWTANYGVPGTGNDDPDLFDIQRGSNGWAAEYEADSDRTWFDWYIPNPHFTVFPEWEFFDGLEWPDGATVDITVAGKEECAISKESWGGFFNGNFPEGCDLEIDDTVTFADGTTTRTHVVRNLDVTDINLENDTISGIADPGSVVYVWPHDGWFEPLQAIANGSGAWKVDLGDVGYDIVEGASGRSEIRDEAGNATAVDWYIPNPTFVAYMPVTIVGYDWPIGDKIDISINNDEYTARAEVGNADWDPTVVLFELWRDDFTMEAGDHIVMTDRSTHVSKEVWVTNLAVTDFDLNTGKVFGTYDPAYNLWTWLYDLEGQVPETDPDNGTWVATFTELPPGAWGGATQWDIDGDGTSIDFQVPNTRVVIAVGAD